MNPKRIWAMFKARNHEFFRDKAAFGWNFAFPFLIILGFGFIFNGENYQKFKVGIYPARSTDELSVQANLPQTFLEESRIQFIAIDTAEKGRNMLHQHKIDLFINTATSPHTYLVNSSSPKGYIAEKLYQISFFDIENIQAQKQTIEEEEIRYIDWFFPGILGMNMMFSALWGVGYIIVRYRKNGALKRLKATPLTAFEYLISQLISRLFLMLFTTLVVWIGSDLIFDFQVHGSFLLIFFLYFLGSLSLIAIGLILASRGTSEEFTSGVLNFISWPMMFLSEVWFSLEGAPRWIQNIANIFPLKHMISAIREVMNNGVTLADVQYECIFLLVFTAVALALAASLFSWNE